VSETGEAKDACASRAKPRLEERVCEHGRRPTLIGVTSQDRTRRAHRSARRRAIEAADALACPWRERSKEAAT